MMQEMVMEEPEVKLFSWVTTTNHFQLLVYAILARRGDDYLYIEDHCIIKKQEGKNSSEDTNNA